MRNIIITILFIGFISATPLLGQSVMEGRVITLEQAIALAMENNQAIQLERKDVELAKNEVYAGNANLLPTLSFEGSASFDNNDTENVIRTFQEDPPTVFIEDPSATSTTYSAALEANYVLLGGFSGRYQFRLLKDQHELALLEQQVIINETIVSVSDIYLEVYKLQRQKEVLQKNITLGENRLQKIEDQFRFGKTTSLSVLRAKADLNQDRSSLDDVLVSESNLKQDLNFLMGQLGDTPYEVAIDYQVPPASSIETLRSVVEANNPEILLSKKGVDIAEHEYRMSTSSRLPQVNAFASYGYFDQENDLQQLAEVRTLGYSIGVGVSYPLFQGGKINREIQSARIGQERSQIQKMQSEYRILADAMKEYNNLRLLTDQLKREEENLALYQEDYARTEAQFFNGNASSLDLRTAQNALLAAEIKISDLRADRVKSSLVLETLKGNALGNR